MWDDFSDFELVGLAFTYGLKDYLETATWNTDLRLTDRPKLEAILILHEYNVAFALEKSLDFNSEVAYN
jgi:hypothetical protein